MYSAAPVTAVAASDWLNGIIQGNSSGELVGTFPHQLMIGLDKDRALKTKKVVRITNNAGGQSHVLFEAFELHQVGG